MADPHKVLALADEAKGFIAPDTDDLIDQAGMSFELVGDGTLIRAVVGVAMGYGGKGLIRIPVELSERDTEQLYELAYTAVVNQIRVNTPDTAIPERLPRVITDYDLPQPLPDPLVFQEDGRKRVLDDRVQPSPYQDRRMYIAGVIVHLSECRAAAKLPRSGQRGAGRGGDWVDLLPAVSQGKLVPLMCTKCKPLGGYTAAINARLAWSTFSTPPKEMPLRVHGFEAIDPENHHRNAKQARVLQELTIMTPARWEAFTDLLRHCIEDGYAPIRDAGL